MPLVPREGSPDLDTYVRDLIGELEKYESQAQARLTEEWGQAELLIVLSSVMRVISSDLMVYAKLLNWAMQSQSILLPVMAFSMKLGYEQALDDLMQEKVVL